MTVDVLGDETPPIRMTPLLVSQLTWWTLFSGNLWLLLQYPFCSFEQVFPLTPPHTWRPFWEWAILVLSNFGNSQTWFFFPGDQISALVADPSPPVIRKSLKISKIIIKMTMYSLASRLFSLKSICALKCLCRGAEHMSNITCQQKVGCYLIVCILKWIM